MSRRVELPVEAIEVSAALSRLPIEEGGLEGLKLSIAAVGVLQPVEVRELGGGRYELVAGRRRLRAAKAAGIDAIPAIIRDAPDDAAIRDAMREG